MWKEEMDRMGMISFIAYILVLIGGINLGLMGLFEINVLGKILGGLSRILFIVMGAGAGYLLYVMFAPAKKEVG